VFRQGRGDSPLAHIQPPHQQDEEEMSSNGRILVTGATGNVGREVIQELRRRGQRIVAAVYDEKDAARAPEGVETVRFDFGRAETFAPALAGIEKMFFMRPPQISDVERYLHPAIDAAQAAGVKQIAFLSLMGVNPRVPHYKVEQKILASGIPYTFLRPSFFIQNLETVYRDEIRVRDELFIPAGAAKTSFIDVRDIGVVAGMTLSEPGHENKAYTLTGSEALDYYEVADIFSHTQGRRITYLRPTPAEYAARQQALGVPDEFIQVMRSLYWTVRLGIGKKVTPELAELLGRAPITMKQYAVDFKERFSAATPEEKARAQPLPGIGSAPRFIRPAIELMK
jgi:uncharacterized protein YbjT (DUF2867 family)